MEMHQVFTGCLAQGAYYIKPGNGAAVIDPLREVQPYLDRAVKLMPYLPKTPYSWGMRGVPILHKIQWNH